jgi:hypothetical protein
VPLLLLVALGLAASCPVGSAVAVFSKQVTVGANAVSTAAGFPVCYRDAVLADSPVGYWKLDETSGSNAADSVGGRTGTYTNGPVLGQSGALPDAVNNKAVSLDGSNDRISVPYAAALSPATFTLEAWVKLNGTASWQEVAGSYDETSPGGGYRGYWLGVNGTNWNWEIDNGTTYTLIGAPVPAVGSWTHLVGTFDGTTGKLYANGALIASSAAAYAPNANSPFAIGSTYYRSSANWSDAFNGAIDEVALYNTALTATKIRTHYNTGRCYKDAVLADNPAGYWRLGETSGATAADGMRGRHGTYTNAPTLNQTGALNGDANPAVTFDGTTEYVSVPYDSALNPGQVTLEAWARPTGGTGTARTIAATQDTNKGYLLGIGTDDKWRFTIGTGAATTVVTGPAVTLSSWVHVVGTYNGTTATLYVNGISAGTASVTGSANTTRPLGIGATDAGGTWAGYFPGSIDEVALFASALSQSRVQAHYLLGRSYQDTVLDSGPVSFWRLGESSGTSAADSKGSNTGTYTNGPTLGRAGGLAGDADTSVNFDGSNDVLTTTSSISGPTTFSLEAWFNTTTSSGGKIIGFEDSNTASDGPNYDRLIYMANDGTLVFAVWPGSNVTVQSGAAYKDGDWHQVVATMGASGMVLYVDGVSVGTNANSTAQSFTGYWRIGEGNLYNWSPAPTSYAFAGRIDDVAVYNRALLAAEVQLHYDSGRQ